jgi:hypothetical protein
MYCFIESYLKGKKYFFLFMDGQMTPEEFYAMVAAKGLALRTKPVVPHGLFAAYLENSEVDVRVGYGVLAFLGEQGSVGFDVVYSRATGGCTEILRDVGPEQKKYSLFT